MKRGYCSSDDEYSYDSDDDEYSDDEGQEEVQGAAAMALVERREITTLSATGFAEVAGDDRPCVISGCVDSAKSATYFDFHPKSTQVDPIASGSVVTGVSPHGSTLVTLEYNLRHAVENRDEARTATCLTEFFRFFVLLNRPMQRFVSSHLERQTRVEMLVAVGPFANPASLGLHQRLFATLVGVCVRQVGVASPCALSYLVDEWKAYENVLFHLPAKALAKLLGIGATLCNCRKDASVAYTRHVFEDTSKMREWRTDVLKRPDLIATYIPLADQAYKARKMLLNNKVYFNNRLRLRRYQTVCIGTPHPEYMCQGGCMHRSHTLKLVDAIKQSIPRETGVEALSIVQDVEDTMVYLGAHVNNMYDRDAYEALQVDLQIFLYLLQRVLGETSREQLQGPDSLLHTSRAMVAGAPRHITEDFARRLWLATPDTIDLLRYGICGDPAIKAGRASRKRGLTLNDLVDAFQPVVVPKCHEWAPPSVFRDEDNIVHECAASEIQRNPAVRSLRFLFGLYRLHFMWGKCTSTKISVKGDADRITVDREFFDVKQAHRKLYRCNETGVLAVEVSLQGNAAAEIMAAVKSGAVSNTATGGGGNDENRQPRKERIQTTDAGEAEIFADHLCRPDDTGGRKAVKAVMIGPWPLQEAGRLEKEIAYYHDMKKALNVEPDVVFVKRMMLLDYAAIAEETKPESQILGKVYAWVVYVPRLVTRENHVVMTIDELKAVATQDVNLQRMAKAILRPMSLVRPIAVMKRSCGEFSSWKIGDNYVSFSVRTEGSAIVIDDIRIHTITETLLGRCPDYRKGSPSNVRTTELIRNIVGKCRTHTAYAGASVELAQCENLLNHLT